MRRITVAIAVGCALVLASTALAGNGPTTVVYGNKGANVQKSLGVKHPTVTTPSTTVTTPSNTSPATLPFTGLDLGLVSAAGVLLVGVGFTLRRVTRKPPTG
jgi:hypothetical protein